MNSNHADLGLTIWCKTWCQFWVINIYKPGPTCILILIQLRDIKKIDAELTEKYYVTYTLFLKCRRYAHHRGISREFFNEWRNQCYWRLFIIIQRYSTQVFKMLSKASYLDSPTFHRVGIHSFVPQIFRCQPYIKHCALIGR